jgi:hypothetical protein
MDDSELRNPPSGRQRGQSQGLGAINGMLRGTVSNVGENLRNIVRGEVALARQELKDEATRIGKGGGMIAGSGVLGFTGFIFLMLGITHLLGKKLAMWASAGLVGTALMAVAAVLGMLGKDELQSARLKPKQTIESLREKRRGQAVR